MTADRLIADRYRLDHEIGRGGMGTVWLAHDTVLRRDVAVKQIGMIVGAATPDLARAQREAHLAARVNHRHVVAVYDLVDDGAQQWLVMELVDGPSLAGLIGERGPLPADELVPVARQVADALAAAHDHGIVHRDVKPSNILLTRGGVAKLSDFGIARAQADASLTRTGLVVGSPAYLSPEVVSGGVATAASDVWSLGATLFHALEGRAPYEVDDNLMGAMYRIVNEPPPRPRSGGRLDAAVAAMMQHDPARRPTMEQIAADLDVAEDARPTSGAVDLEATQGFDVVTGAPAPVSAPEPAPTAAFSPVEPGRPSAPVSTSRPWLVPAAVAVVLAVVVGAVVGTRGGSGGGAPGSDRTTATAPSATAAMERFARDYLAAADADPRQGFALLTPAYQQASGGLAGYTDFWGGVSGVDVERVEADPAASTVTYRYSYAFDGRRTTEAVTLQLVRSGDGYLVAGAS